MNVPGSFPADFGSPSFSTHAYAYELAASGYINNSTDGAHDGRAELEDHGARLQAAATSSSSSSRRTGATSEEKIVIAVFGMTGTGKSTFISKLTGQNVEIGHGLQSCTTGIHEISCRIGQVDLTLLDTPGFDDTTRADTEILKLIGSWMKDAYGHGTLLAGVIYLHRINDNRMSGTSLKNIRLLRSMCGTANLANVVLASSMWDKVTEAEGSAREQELLQRDDFWGDLRRHGARVRRCDNTPTCALALVSELLPLNPVVLQFQREVAIEQKKLIETEAGRVVDEDLRSQVTEYEKDLVEVKGQLSLVQETDRENRRLLEKERRQILADIEQRKKERKDLLATVNRRAWYQFSWKCVKCHSRLTKRRGSDSDPQGKCPGCGKLQIFV